VFGIIGPFVGTFVGCFVVGIVGASVDCVVLGRGGGGGGGG